MKKMISIILAIVMLFVLCVMPASADDSQKLQMTVNGGERYVVIDWNEITYASRYEVIIRDPDTRDVYVDEYIDGLSFNWEPGYDVSPNEKFEIRVVALNGDGVTCARSNVEIVTIYVILWDYWGSYGDVDNDFNISVLDATIIQRYLAKQWEFDVFELRKADVDYDDVVSALDGNAIQRYCAGYEDKNVLLGEGFMVGGIDYEVVPVEPQEKPTVVPTIEPPTEEQPTQEPTDPTPPISTSAPIIILPIVPIQPTNP